jgi:sec-independent protein translocase protein TatA
MGLGELLVILLIILVVFGRSRLPGVARGIGRGIRNFKDASHRDGSNDP